MERLTGKTALVVGAGSIGPGWGNGKATAVTFARQGAQVFRLDPSSRHLLCQLRHDQGRDEPDDAHHGGRVRAETYKGQRHSAGPDENADGRALRWPGGELRRGRRRGDVARARRAGADGAHGGSLGRRQRRTVFSPPTNQNTSPASNWWSMAALR